MRGPMSQMLKSSGAMGLATLLSRVLGLVREMAYARFMGRTWVADAFIFAYTVPNLFRRLLGEGALTAAFLPSFKAREKEGGEAAMWEAANAVISGLVVAVSALVGVAMVVISLLLLGDGWSEKTRLMLQLMRLMFPYLLLVCLAAVGMGMLNARGRFFVPALGAAMLNVVMIGSVFLLAPRFGARLEDQVIGLGVGVLLAGVAQALFQVPALARQGWRFRWVSPWRNPVVREVVPRMLPATVGVAAFQLNVVVTQSFAFFAGESIVSAFQFAVRLMEMPQGVFGISLATYLLPTLAGFAAEKRWAGFRDTLHQGVQLLLFVNLLAAMLLFVLARPIVRLFFEGGLFRASDTLAVAQALMLLAPGLVAFSLTNVLARAFYATGDLRTPMWISVFCLGANTLLAIPLVFTFAAAGLAAANTVTATLNVLLLGYALRRKFRTLALGTLRRPGGLLLLALVPATAAAAGASFAWELLLGGTGFWARLGAVFVPMLLAAGTYFPFALWLRLEPATEVLNLLRRRRSGSA